MAEQVCFECGCEIGDRVYETDGYLYCCEPCATDAECECGCMGCGEEEED